MAMLFCRDFPQPGRAELVSLRDMIEHVRNAAMVAARAGTSMSLGDLPTGTPGPP